MIARAGSGWQTILADLALILFIVTAAVVTTSNGGGSADAVNDEAGNPVAIFRASSNSPNLPEWLKDQHLDDRQRLTITSQYEAAEAARALREAERLLEEAGDAIGNVRVVIEPGAGGLTAALTYDAQPDEMARDLQNSNPNRTSNGDDR